MWNQSFNPALICTLPDLCSFLGAAACADVLYRRPPPTTTSTHPPSLPRPCEPGQQPNINNNHSACFHLSYPALSFTGAATLQHAPPLPRCGRASLPPPRRGDHRHSGRSVHAAPASPPLPLLPLSTLISTESMPVH